jgi:tRNA A37 threonylcarbamoyladenosine modification protein TsaB
MYTIEDYKWNLNPRFIKIMCADNTHIHYLSEKEKKMKNAVVINSVDDLMNDLGIDINNIQK